MEKRTKKEYALWFGGIFLFSILLFLSILLGNRDAFSADDNILQWGPVIQTGFDNIFAGHGIPYWNFFQYKGLDIFSSGYYGFTNPFMYISYMISRYIFQGTVLTLIIYIWLLYYLGLNFMFLALNDLKLKRSTIFVSLLAYATPLFFFLYSFYYFEFNCYLMLPLLSWVMLRTHGKKGEWVIPGLLLAFSLILGHVQYACYFVMVYCIIMTVWAVAEKDRANIQKLFVNVGIFLFLSACLLDLSLRVSENRDAILSNISKADFYSYDIPLTAFFSSLSVLFTKTARVERGYFQANLGLGVFSYLPFLFLMPALKRAFAAAQAWMDRRFPPKGASEEERKHYKARLLLLILSVFLFFAAFYFSLARRSTTGMPWFLLAAVAVLICLLLLLFHWLHFHTLKISDRITKIAFNVAVISFFFMIPVLIGYIVMIAYYVYISMIRKKKESFTSTQIWIHTLLFAAAFFIFFAVGHGSGLAELLSIVPVFNSFRHLYKCAFIFIPLLILVGAYALDGLKKDTKKIVCILSVILSATYVVNIIYMMRSGYHRYIRNTYYSYCDRETIEKEVEEQLVSHQIDRNYRFVTLGDESLYVTGDTNTGIEYSSHICVYALTKNYATLYEVFSIGGYDNIFSSKGFNATNLIQHEIFLEGMYDNMIAFPSDYTDEIIANETFLPNFEKQWKKCGLRYLLVPSEGAPAAEHFLSIFDLCEDLTIVSRTPWLYGFDLVEIEGTNPICSYDNGTKLPIEARIDRLSFQTDFSESTPVEISMTYDTGYRLKLKDRATGQITYATLKENEMGYTTATIPAGSYDASFVYENRMMDGALIISAVVTILSLASLIFVASKYRPDTEK